MTDTPKQSNRRLCLVMALSIPFLLALSLAGQANAATASDASANRPSGKVQVDVNQASGNGSDDGANDEYPHIAALEKSILGATYPGQTLTARLERLEIKAFGKPANNPDLSERTDNLEQFAEKTLHKNPYLPASSDDFADIPVEQPPNTASPASPASATASTAGAGRSSAAPAEDNYPRVTSLESVILKETYIGQPLADRLARMETKAFGAPTSDPDLSHRTDVLEEYAEKNLHKKPIPQNNGEQTASAQGANQGNNAANRKKQIINMVGNTLLGLAGVGTMGGIAGPLMPGMVGTAAGMANRGKGSDQINSGNNAQAQQKTEDPAIYADKPPAPDSKMLTKVGWCEVKTFGHTFTPWHLTQRLEQLNQELNFAPGKYGIDLMDDVNQMIGAVLKRSASTASGPPGTAPTMRATTNSSNN